MPGLKVGRKARAPSEAFGGQTSLNQGKSHCAQPDSSLYNPLGCCCGRKLGEGGQMLLWGKGFPCLIEAVF